MIRCSRIALQLNVVASYVVSSIGLQGPGKSGRSWGFVQHVYSLQTSQTNHDESVKTAVFYTRSGEARLLCRLVLISSINQR
jgi:hypothetical protein